MEWQSSCQKSKEDNTARPDIGHMTSVWLALDDFRTCIVWTAAASLQHSPPFLQFALRNENVLTGQGSHTEVSELDSLSVFCQQDILRFEITMAESEIVYMTDGIHELLEQLQSFVGGKGA